MHTVLMLCHVDLLKKRGFGWQHVISRFQKEVKEWGSNSIV